MNGITAHANELRVLLRLVSAKDNAAVIALLARSGIASQACADATELATGMADGAGAVLIAEELLETPAFAQVVHSLRAQPPWSDLPVIVAARSGLDSMAITEAIEQLGSVTVLERPMRVSSLVSAVRSALAARKRQYQLRTTLDGLREADQRKTEFLATLAHELRNPLAPLRTALAVVSRQSPSPEKFQSLCAMMDRQVSHMVRLIDDLTEVSRITRGQITLRACSVAMDSVVREAVEVNRPLFAAAGQEVLLQVGACPCHVHGDEMRLTQVLSNLLTNASKFTPRGGRVCIAMEPVGDIVRVSVSDSGIGIPAAMLESVFGMFVQVPGAQRGTQDGLGIGLTLARSLVELHGGRVSASSPGANAGTKVTVELPLCAAPVLAPALAAPTEPAEIADIAEGHQILVVDDNRDAADSLAQLFGHMGARVSVAYGANEALKVMASAPPTIAFIDIGMPGMDGHELAARIRGNGAPSSMVLVALTGWGQDTDRERVMNSGFDHHLIKPADVNQLQRLLEAKV